MSDIELSYYPLEGDSSLIVLKVQNQSWPFTPSALFSRHERKIGYRRFEFSWILLE